MGLTFKKPLPVHQTQQYDQSDTGQHNRKPSLHQIDIDELSDDDSEIMFVRQKPMSTSSPRDLYGGSQTLTAAAAPKQFPAMERPVPPLLKKPTISSRFSRVPALFPIAKSQPPAVSATQSLLMNGYGNVCKPMPMNGFDSLGYGQQHQQQSHFQSGLSLRKSSVSRHETHDKQLHVFVKN